MKICLSTSPHLNHSFYYQGRSTNTRIVTLPFVPLGLLSLAACLEERRKDVEVIDLNRPIGGGVPNDQDYYRNVARLIQRHEPDVLGFMTDADSYHHVLNISEECKRLRPRTVIVLGGPHASVTDYETLKNFPFIDVIVRGEGEATMVELVEGLQRDGRAGSVRGVSYRSESGAVVRNEDRPLLDDLDTLPVPAYHLYNISPTDTVYVEAGRGCPHACTFCFTAPYWKKKYRVKSPERIFSEMALLKERYGLRHFNLVHDLFTTDRRWVQGFCNGLLERGLDVTWACSSRTDTVDAGLLGLMARAGCKAIYYGLDAGSEKMQKTIKKCLDLQGGLEVIRQTMSLGIEATVGLMVGFPWESEDSLSKTIGLFFSLLRMDVPKVHIFRVCPFKGSLMHEDYKGLLYFDGHFLDFPLRKTLRGKGMGLMRRYPEIFSGYHRYRTRLEDEDLLKGIDELSPIMGLFRYPLLALLEGSGDGLELFRRWAQWISDHNLNYHPSKPLTHYGTAGEFLLFLKDTAAEEGGSGYINDLLRYEEIKNNLREASASAPRPPTGDSIRQRQADHPILFPRKNRYVRIKKFNYNVKGIIEQIKAGNVNPEERSCHILFFIDGLGKLNTARVNRFGTRLIGLCNGRLPIQDIASKLTHSRASPGDQAYEDVMDAVRRLREMNVIEEKTYDTPHDRRRSGRKGINKTVRQSVIHV